MKLFKNLRKKWRIRNLRAEVAKWVEKNLGKEWVNEALEKYDKINCGIPIGGFFETVVFLEMIEQIKSEL